MQPLSGLDSTFLYLESPHIPMHVGSVLVFEGSMKFEDFRETVSSRIHLVPRMRQRLVMVPLGIGKPYWVDDPNFDIDVHMQHIALPKPGGWRQLRRLAERTFSVCLDRTRPLWEMVFVEGLNTIPQVPSGSVALISKVHHAAIDGVSGGDMMSILFDITKEPREVDPAPERKPAPVPNELTVLAQTARKIAGKPRKVPGLLRDALRTVFAGGVTKVRGVATPPSLFSAPSTPLNRPVCQQRAWNTALLSLDRVKAIKQTMNCTLNDVVLAICAGALRRYLQEKDALPEKPLVSMVPVSTRAKEAHGTMGNQVSAMWVQLATQIEDPIERLLAIQKQAKASKAHQSAVGAHTLANFAEFIPFGLASNASRLYSRFDVAKHHNPVFNVVITNVPGPQVDLYIARHKLLATMGMAPIIDGMGLIITVLSYNGVLSISPTSSKSVMPDIDLFARYLRESANEIELAVLKANPVAETSNSPAQHTEATVTFFERMKSQLADTPEEKDLGRGTFQFHVTGCDKSWFIALAERQIAEGNIDNPDATFTIRDEHLAQIVKGKLDPQMAFVQGKLRVDGDVGKAVSLGGLLSSARG